MYNRKRDGQIVTMSDAQSDHDEGSDANGYRRALELLDRCSTPDGVPASPAERADYLRIRGRDGVILGPAAAAVMVHPSLKGEAILRGIDHDD